MAEVGVVEVHELMHVGDTEGWSSGLGGLRRGAAEDLAEGFEEMVEEPTVVVKERLLAWKK